MTDFARSERLALADLLDQLGPDAATLCAGWTTTDLALHLVLRERADPAVIGAGLRPLAGVFARRRRVVTTRYGYSGLVRLFREGPPRWSPFAIPGVDRKANTVEYFVHHEDVRRAQPNWTARTLPAEQQSALFSVLRLLGRRLARNCAAGVEVATPQGLAATVRKGTPVARLIGAPSELVLYMFGRRGVADVTIDGDPAAREALAHAKLGA